MGLFCKFLTGAALFGSVAAFAATVNNPVIWSDSPDPSIVRVEDSYYMVTTTMHYAPGVPIFKSTDLAQWRTIGYAYETLTDSDNMNLNGGKDAYGKGSWASSIRYRKSDGYYYILTPSYTTGKTHLYKTKDIDAGGWTETILPFYHDPSLFFDDDGTAWVFYGNSPVSYVQLNDDASGVKAGGKSGSVGGSNVEAVLGNNYIVKQEGSHMEKYNGEYYLFTISWPSGNGRTEVVYRSKNLLTGYTGRIFLQDNGVAQGGIFDTPEGDWYALLFRDSGPIGRIAHLVPMVWKDGWPEPSGGTKKAPATLDLPNEVEPGYGMVTSDDFDGDELPLEWQWNHNPDNANWKLTDGKLRITTSRTDARITSAKNTLTQRTFGPKCVGRTLVDGTNMKDGDMAGIAALQDDKGFVALAKDGSGYKVVMYQGDKDGESLKDSKAISGSKVYLRTDFDIPIDKGTASFYYSEDGKTWNKIGSNVSLSFNLHFFTGNRFALFNFATKTAGGYAEFDWFKVGVDENDEIYLDNAAAEPVPQTAHNATATPWAVPGTIQAEDFDDPGKGKGGSSYSDGDSDNKGDSKYRDGTPVDLYEKDDGRIVVGYNTSGDWLEYTINAAKAGDYTLFSFVAAAGSTASFKISIDGKDVTDELAVPAAKEGEGNYDEFNFVKANVSLTAGEHIMRFTVVGDWLDVDKFVFVEGKDAKEPVVATPGKCEDVTDGDCVSIGAIRLNVAGEQNYRVFTLNGNALGTIRSTGANVVDATRAFVKQSGVYIVKPTRGGLMHKISVTK